MANSIIAGNDFRLIIRAKKSTGAYLADMDLADVEDLRIYLTRAGRSKVLQSYTLDDEGHAVIYVSAGAVTNATYGIEMVGVYGGARLRAHNTSVFTISGHGGGNSGVLNDYYADIVFVINLAATDVYVQNAIEAHNENEASHPHLLQLIEEAGDVDDVQIDGESIVDGNKIAKIDSSQFGKVDDVKVNGTSVVSNKEANITIPEKVSDLPNDADYATKSELTTGLDAKQDTISAVAEPTIADDGGNPSASVNFEGGEMAFAFRNLKLRFSDLTPEERATLKGDKGDQGDSAVYDPSSPDAPDFVMANTTGLSTTKTMTQKAVTDELRDVSSYEYIDIDISTLTKVSAYISQNKWANTSSSANKCKMLEITPGKVYKFGKSTGHEWHAFFLTTNEYTIGQTPSYAGGLDTMPAWVALGAYKMMKAPEDAHYLYMRITVGNVDCEPDVVQEVIPIKDKLSSVSDEVAKKVEKKDIQENLSELGVITYKRIGGDISEIGYSISNANVWIQQAPDNKCKLIPIQPGQYFRIIPPTGSDPWCSVAFLTTDTITVGAQPSYAGGITTLPAWSNVTRNIIAPNDAQFLYVRTQSIGHSVAPKIYTPSTEITVKSNIFTNSDSVYWLDGNISGSRHVIDLNYHNRYVIIGRPKHIKEIIVTKSVSSFNLSIFASANGTYWESFSSIAAANTETEVLNVENYKYLGLVLWETPTDEQAKSVDISVDGLLDLKTALGNKLYYNPIVHDDLPDPTIWDGEDGYYYLFATGVIDTKTIYRSANLVDWENTGDFLLTDTAKTALHNAFGTDTTFWAPCVKKMGANQWNLYVSSPSDGVAIFTSKYPSFGYEFVRFTTASFGRYIDPDVAIERDGSVWMFAGSTYKMYRRRMQSDGLDFAENSEWEHVAGRPQSDSGNTNRVKTFEGAYLYRRKGYWYLFCSSGIYYNDTYALRVVRSSTLDGDFVDKEGNLATDGYAEYVIQSDSAKMLYGPGHNGQIFVDKENKTWMLYHCHWMGFSSTSKRGLCIDEIKWDEDGWPYVDGGVPSSSDFYPKL